MPTLDAESAVEFQKQAKALSLLSPNQVQVRGVRTALYCTCYTARAVVCCDIEYCYLLCCAVVCCRIVHFDAL